MVSVTKAPLIRERPYEAAGRLDELPRWNYPCPVPTKALPLSSPYFEYKVNGSEAIFVPAADEDEARRIAQAIIRVAHGAIAAAEVSEAEINANGAQLGWTEVRTGPDAYDTDASVSRYGRLATARATKSFSSTEN